MILKPLAFNDAGGSRFWLYPTKESRNKKRDLESGPPQTPSPSSLADRYDIIYGKVKEVRIEGEKFKPGSKMIVEFNDSAGGVSTLEFRDVQTESTFRSRRRSTGYTDAILHASDKLQNEDLYTWKHKQPIHDIEFI